MITFFPRSHAGALQIWWSLTLEYLFRQNKKKYWHSNPILRGLTNFSSAVSGGRMLIPVLAQNRWQLICTSQVEWIAYLHLYALYIHFYVGLRELRYRLILLHLSLTQLSLFFGDLCDVSFITGIVHFRADKSHHSRSDYTHPPNFCYHSSPHIFPLLHYLLIISQLSLIHPHLLSVNNSHVSLLLLLYLHVLLWFFRSHF